MPSTKRSVISAEVLLNVQVADAHAPQDQAREDGFADADLPRVDCGEHLKRAVTKEK